MAVKKDYYRILNVKASASAKEIKTAYRRLAMQYHPDRNPDDALAAAVFADAAEAYHILHDVDTRKKYNYERHITAEEEYQRPVETIETLVTRIKKINGQVKQSDPFRFNKAALLYSIKQLLPDDINLLVNVNNALLKNLLTEINIAAAYLSSFQTKQVIDLLQPFYTNNAWLQQNLNILLQQQQKTERWEKYKIILAVIIAIALCLLIFFIARR